VQPRRRGTRHLCQRGVRDVGGAGQLGCAEIVCLALHPGDLVGRHAAEDGLCAFRHGLHDDEVAEAFEEILHEAAGVVPRLDDAVHGAEDRGSIGSGDGLDDVVQ
jgi:hypothetical protein